MKGKEMKGKGRTEDRKEFIKKKWKIPVDLMYK